MADRFKIVFEAATDLIAVGKINRATMLMEECGLLLPPKTGESPQYYRMINALLKGMRPADAENWACPDSPDGFCHSDGVRVGCIYCDECIERH